MVERMEVLEHPKSHLAAATVRMKRLADKSTRDEILKEGYEVILSTKNLGKVDSHLPINCLGVASDPSLWKKLSLQLPTRLPCPQDCGYGRLSM